MTALAAEEEASFLGAPDADGWMIRHKRTQGNFLDSYGEVRVRVEGPRHARIRLQMEGSVGNIWGFVHGGFLLAVVDISLFIGPSACGVKAFGGSTVDVSSQFLAPVKINQPMDSVVEVLRETKRLVFVRGTFEQDGEAKLAFSGTVRKPS